MFSFLVDFKQAVRALARRPGFTLVSIATLALGIGANTAMFSAVYHTLINPLPFEGADRLANLYQTTEGGGIMINPPLEYLDAWRKQPLRTVEQLQAFAAGEYSLQQGAEPEVVHGIALEPGMLSMLRLVPVLGRNILPSDLVPGAQDVVLITEGMWRRRFGGERSALGKQIVLNEKPHEIIGVMPNDLARIDEHTRAAQLFIPLRRAPGERVFASTVTRLRPGATVEQASLELQQRTVGVQLEHVIQGDWKITAMAATDILDDGTRRALPILLGSVALVLLIACANLAGLLLVRLAARRREIAIRAALGAGRIRIMRHLWAESVTIAVLGGIAGLLFAGWGIDLVRAVRPENLDTFDAMVLDTPALLFASGLALLTAVLFGLTPLLTLARRDLTAEIGSGGAGSRITENGRFRAALVIGEIAVSVVLLIGAALLIRSVQEIQRRPLGFEQDGVLTARLQLPETRYKNGAAREAFADQLLDHLRAMPNVQSATVGSGMPPALGMMLVQEFEIEGKPGAGEKLGNAIGGAIVDPSFFRTLGIRVIEGQPWQGSNASGAIINETMARMIWPGESAVGKRYRAAGSREPMWEPVVAVVGDVATGHIGGAPRPQIYNRLKYEWNEMVIAVRVGEGDPTALIPAIKRLVAQLDPSLPLRDVATMETLVKDTIAKQRFSMALLTTFAALAIVLALVGLYGVISNMVSRRSHEIGVRLALGASPASVRRMVLTEGMTLTAIGLGVGAVSAIGVMRVIKSLLYGVSTTDPISFAAALMLLGAGAMVACWIPARRATGVDPLVVLRSE